MAPPLGRWDSGWYWSIVREGYSVHASSSQNNVGFYPLYPLAVRAASGPARLPVFPTGIAISLIGVLVAMMLLARFDPPAGPDTLFAMLLFPASFFLAAFYAEGLYLATSVAAFFLARRGHWISSGLAAAAACLTRVNGITLLPALLWLMIEARRRDDGRDDAVRLTALAAAVCGAIAYPVYLWRHFGDPLLYFHDKMRGWPTFSIGRFWNPLLLLVHQVLFFARHPGAGGKLPFAVEVAGLALLVGTVIWCARRRRTAELLYSGSMLALLLFSGNFDSLHRYVAAMFPCFFAAGDVVSRSNSLRITYGILGAGAGLLLLVHFVRWKYVG